MTSRSARDILSLYKELLKYGKTLTLTDKIFFAKRIKSEFKRNQFLTSKEEIQFHYNRKRITEASKNSMNMFPVRLWRHISLARFVNSKSKIDTSRVPVIKEEDLEERFVKGSGPGGSAVNTTSNCVVVKHLPTGTVVKCHQTRWLDENRKIARELLVTKLDNMLNREFSVESQKKKIEENKSSRSDQRKRKLREIKKKWKEQEGLK